MAAYYNENNPYAAQWLRNLIAAGHIAAGDVDDRSIEDVHPDDLRGYAQCHFFAGIGGWPYALRLAGVPDDAPIWTGSCPCQPFSAAGKRKGFSDERHLWPVWFELIRECRPAIVFGEQVASTEGLAWLSGEVTPLQTLRDREAVLGVLRELERQSPLEMQSVRTGFGARPEAVEPGEDIRTAESLARQEARLRPSERCTAPSQVEGAAFRSGPEGHSNPHRTWRMRDDGDPVRPNDATSMECTVSRPDNAGRGLHEEQHPCCSLRAERDVEHMGAEPDSGDCECDHCSATRGQRAIASRFDGSLEAPIEWPGQHSVCADLESAGYACAAANLCAAGVGAPHIRQRMYWMAYSNSAGLEGWLGEFECPDKWPAWSDGVVIPCRDGKNRIAPAPESGILPMVDGLPNRMEQLCAYGNAIVPQVAAEFVMAALSAIEDTK